ncbi:hypothetical protein BGZ72_002272 [Mortierella alpina]|nr:hypothetical protein BGZ72_002272 [Mortierella alpina]
MLVVDGVLSELYSIYMNSKIETSSRDSSSSREDHASGGLQEPLPIHIYQPRLTLTPNERTPVHSGTTAPTNGNTEAAQQDDDSVELEELPKYERRRPAQQATIVDMANLQSVDANVLGSAIPVSPLSLTDNEGRGFEQGQPQELRLELGELSTVEAPEYAPSLVEASPAPTYDMSTQLASSTSSGSSVVLAMPVSEPPVGQSPTAAHTDAPTYHRVVTECIA